MLPQTETGKRLSEVLSHFAALYCVMAAMCHCGKSIKHDEIEGDVREIIKQIEPDHDVVRILTDSLSRAKVNRAIEFVARVVAADRGAGLCEGGASLQTAQMTTIAIDCSAVFTEAWSFQIPGKFNARMFARDLRHAGWNAKRRIQLAL